MMRLLRRLRARHVPCGAVTLGAECDRAVLHPGPHYGTRPDGSGGQTWVSTRFPRPDRPLAPTQGEIDKVLRAAQVDDLLDELRRRAGCV